MDESSMYDVVRPILDAAPETEPPSMQCFDSKLATSGLLINTVNTLSTPMPHGLIATMEHGIFRFLWKGGNLSVGYNVEGEEAIEIMLDTLFMRPS